MPDNDLAKLYGTDTKRVNEAVTRNKEKFPERFSWKVTKEELKDFLVANCDQKIETRGGRYTNPRVFTEQGVAMLITIKTKNCHTSNYPNYECHRNNKINNI